jgi:hypothetical protein
MAGQKGFALLEVSIAALLATLLAVWGASALADAMKDASARASAAWMLQVREGARQYLARHGPALRAADVADARALAGYADWAAPTLTELQGAAILPPGLPLQVAAGGGAVIRVLRSGVCPGSDCRLDALVHSAQPLRQKDGAQVDQRQVAQWLLAAQGQGGWVSERQPEMLRGRVFSLRNAFGPGGALPPGTVAMMAGDGAEVSYLRQGDQRDPDFRGKLTAQSDISARADVDVAGYLLLQARERQGAGCAKDGALALERGRGLLVCLDGIWQAQGRQERATGYTVNSLRGCVTGGGNDNPVSRRKVVYSECSCPEGSQAVQVSEQQPNLLAHGVTRLYICVR